jgi:NAD(P)-dependent dehydrogenase (short-subunit alcohol dehydrogenase family)
MLCATAALACAQAVHPAMKARGQGTMLFTGGGLALRPEYGSAVPSLTAGKSALRGLVHAMAAELAKDGIRAGLITIAGMVEPGTAFDPDRIAESYWRFHMGAAHGTETVFDGSAPG